jgi:hypothetical protein
MKTMLISEFKAKCIAVIKESHLTRTPLIITLRGKPIVRIEPIYTDPHERKLGACKGAMKINGDIVHCDFSDDWEALG